MNERIRELAEQADGVVINKMMTGARQYTFLEEDLEKFAELIVKECAELCRARKLTPSAFIADELLEHFGVKE